MSNLFVETFPVGPLGCNCSIIACNETNEAIVVDPGGDAERIQAVISDNGFTVKEIIHTHAHFDHCMATADISASAPDATVRLHKGDLSMYKHLAQQGALFGIPFDGPIKEIDEFMEDSQSLSFGNQKLKILHTPGHSPGSCCFEISEHENLLFSGDTLFAGGIGRTDLWGGDSGQIMDSIKNRLMTLDRETKVIPGHGQSTSIEIEAKTNPFL